MRIFNKGKRSFIIAREDAISGCRLPREHIAKDKAYIDADTEVEVKDHVAEKMILDYPKEIMAMNSGKKEEKTKKEKSSRRK